LFTAAASPTVRRVESRARIGALIVVLTALGLLFGVAATAVNSTGTGAAIAATGVVVGAVVASIVRRELVPGGRGSSGLWLALAAVIGVGLASAKSMIQVGTLSICGGFLAVCCLLVWRRRATLGRH
jgi:hypothetical protein